MKILLGVTGSVAAKLTPRLIAGLSKAHEVKLITTKAAKYFFDKNNLGVEVLEDVDEWFGEKYEQDSAIAHIELRTWADCCLIAPATANTIAKISFGLADNLLTCVTRAWQLEKPLIIAPAMNTQMWLHPITKEHLERIEKYYNLTVIQPVAKRLACGETGIGAMAGIDEIIKTVNRTKR